MGRKGGVALREKYGVDHLRRIAAEGGHVTLSRYGTGYMAQIGSTGGIKRATQLARLGRTNEMAAYGVPHFAQELDRHITGVYDDFVNPPEDDRDAFDPIYNEDPTYDPGEPYVEYEMVDLPAEGDEIDDDPRCAACGCYRSEHSMLGCSDGFITPEGLRAEREAIYDQLRYEDGDYDYYDNDEVDAQDPYDIEYDVP